MAELIARAKQKIRADGSLALLLSAFTFATHFIRRRVIGLYVIATGDRVEYNGVTLDLSNDQITPAQRSAFKFGTYEDAERRCVDAYLSREADVIELGASIGFLSCYVDNVTTGEQISVEANPELIETLERNRELNGGTFEVCHAAYAPTEDTVPFTVDTNFLEGHVGESARSTSVPAVSLAGLAAQHDLDDFVLVTDIEGAEIELITTELDLVAACCPLVIIELHPDLAYSISEMVSQFEAAGFDIVGEEDNGNAVVAVFERT
ncbi:FkbM family methyltransferase [Halosimplex amylolyticum]|uniref:FkbM family methyltransferase n=1 Tax=Halosimplex amylolyticum TaxID=3396616 RepID=UPI003F55D490